MADQEVLDDIEASLAIMLMNGEIEKVGIGADGEPSYRLTPKGMKMAEDLIRSRGVDPADAKKMSPSEFVSHVENSSPTGSKE